ncbi:MAG: hypothetical protein JXA46_05085 [Dehalococcoidales bacterium]|nr:hypothetical protein [Dehalococcoidales bacterium]
MKSSSRLLTGFGIGLFVLVIVTVVLALSIGQQNAPTLPADTPEGTVQRFLLAVQANDYAAAYDYIIPRRDGETKTAEASYQQFSLSARYASGSTWKANLGQVSRQDQSASVEIILEFFTSGGPFGNPIRTDSVVFNLRKVDNAWLIASPTDLYWLY